MPSFLPNIVTNSTPGVEITSTNVTYDEIKRSLGDFVYYIKRMYTQSTSSLQIREPVNYQRYDANGNQVKETIVPAMDPYQYQNSKFFPAQEFEMVLNGQSSLKFTLLSGVTLKLELFASKIGKKDALNAFNPDNFKALESAMGLYVFFEDWTTKI